MQHQARLPGAQLEIKGNPISATSRELSLLILKNPDFKWGLCSRPGYQMTKAFVKLSREDR